MRIASFLFAVACIAGCGGAQPDNCSASGMCGSIGVVTCTSGDATRCWFATASGQRFDCSSCGNCVSASNALASWCASHAGGSGGSGGGGSGGSGGGGGHPDMAAPPDMTVAHLQSGTYAVSNTATVSDGCQIAPLQTTLSVANTGVTLSIGNYYNGTTTPIFNPAGYALGSGNYTDATHAMLTQQTKVTLSDGCTFSRSDYSSVTFVGMNHLLVDWKHDEDAFGAQCVPADFPPTIPCTSEFSFDLTM